VDLVALADRKLAAGIQHGDEGILDRNIHNYYYIHMVLQHTDLQAFDLAVFDFEFGHDDGVGIAVSTWSGFGKAAVPTLELLDCLFV
jgi:hypothetical protein